MDFVPWFWAFEFQAYFWTSSHHQSHLSPGKCFDFLGRGVFCKHQKRLKCDVMETWGWGGGVCWSVVALYTRWRYVVTSQRTLPSQTPPTIYIMFLITSTLTSTYCLGLLNAPMTADLSLLRLFVSNVLVYPQSQLL